jgi:hypothetical protein
MQNNILSWYGEYYISIDIEQVEKIDIEESTWCTAPFMNAMSRSTVKLSFQDVLHPNKQNSYHVSHEMA